jgi:hypothetical protein
MQTTVFTVCLEGRELVVCRTRELALAQLFARKASVRCAWHLIIVERTRAPYELV